MKKPIRQLLLAAALLISCAAGALEQNWNAADLVRWKGAENAASNANGVLRPLKPALIESKIFLAKGKIGQLKLTVTLERKTPVAPIGATALFQGGKEAGNHYWNQVIRQGIDNDGPVYERYLTVPSDATEVGVKLRLGDNGSTVGIRSVRLEELAPGMMKDQTIELKADPAKTSASPTAFHFGANFDSSNFPGVYYGTLPASNPDSKRADFIRFLRSSGLKSARYPGGTASHWHLPEGREACQKLLKRVNGQDAPMMVGFREFRDTTKEAGLKLIYQLNTSFYLDEKGELQAIDATRFARKGNFDTATPRHEQAAAALERNFRNGTFRPGDVDYWELGNEEFAYMTTEQYAKVCAALIPVIVRNDPGKPICVTGMKGLEDELRKYPEVWRHITGITTHYPYASWPRPSPAYMTANYRDFANADVNFPRNLDGQAKAESGKNISVSETSVYNLFTYDFSRMQPSFALALAIGYNWPELMKRAKVDMAVFHDFESPWFGLSWYDVSFSETQREYKWLSGKTPPARSQSANWFVDPSAANSTHYFPKEYVSSPGMAALNLLSSFAGGKVVESRLENKFGFPGSALAGTDAAGKPQVFLSNPLEIPVLLKIGYPGFPAKCRLSRIDSDSFGAALPGEYRRTDTEIELKNGTIILPARSLTLLTAE